jgi:UPF0716 protein FxsA
MSRLFLLFTVVPAIELYLLVQIGSLFGAEVTVALVLLTGAIGAWLARREGGAVVSQLQADLARGVPPAGRLVEGALVLTGGILLITPGVLSDLTGIALLVPQVRRWLAPRVIAALADWGARHATVVQLGTVGADGGSVFQGPPPRDARPSPFDHPVA